VHVPVLESVTLAPATVQTLGVELAKLAARPLEAVADSVTGPWSTRVSAGWTNAIDCVPGVGGEGIAVTWKERMTSVAAAYVPLPACAATTEHVPTATSAVVAPVIVHTPGVALPKLMASPLDAVAESVTGPWSTRVSPGWTNVIDCASAEAGAAVTWNVRVTSLAGAYVPSPACDAVIEHVPAATRVTVPPETVQLTSVFETRVTARSLVATGANATGP
jgi:hypothetical protein